MKRLLILFVLVVSLPSVSAILPEEANWTQRGFDSHHRGSAPWSIGSKLSSPNMISLSHSLEGFVTWGDAIICNASNNKIILYGKNGVKFWEIALSAKPVGIPLVYNKNIYVTTDDGSVAAFDESNGKTIWSRKALGYCSTDICSSGFLGVFGGSSSVVCFDLRSGAMRWKVNVPKDPLPVAIYGNLIIVNYMRGIRCLRLTDGKTIWDYAAPKDSFEPPNFVGVPTVSQGRAIVCLSNMTTLCFSVFSGKLLWSAVRPYSKANPTIDGGNIYLPGLGKLVCISLGTGKTLWECLIPKDQLWVQAIKTSDFIYLGGSEGSIYVLTPNGKVKERLNIVGGVAIEMSLGYDYLVVADYKYDKETKISVRMYIYTAMRNQ